MKNKVCVLVRDYFPTKRETMLLGSIIFLTVCILKIVSIYLMGLYQ